MLDDRDSIDSAWSAMIMLDDRVIYIEANFVLFLSNLNRKVVILLYSKYWYWYGSTRSN